MLIDLSAHQDVFFATLKEVCLKAASKLSDPGKVVEISLQEKNTFLGGKCSPWEPLSLGYGYPGLALLFSEMDHFYPNDCWKNTCKQYVRLIVSELKEKGFVGLSLFSGLTGVCFSIYILSLHDQFYSKLHSNLHSLLLAELQKYIPILAKRESRMAPLEYGVMSGLNGILTYLLNFTDQSDVRTIIEQMLIQIVKVSESISYKNKTIPGWHADSHYLLPDVFKSIHSEEFIKNRTAAYPEGCFDPGIAHGITGCLAILSQATDLNIRVPGQIEAMQRITNWLMITQQDVGGIERVWPKRFALNTLSEKFYEIPSHEYFDGWSYGAPGILNAMLMSAMSTNDEPLYKYCIKEMEFTADRIRNSKPICPSFFYGLAGPLVILHRLSALTKNIHFADSAFWIGNHIIHGFNDDFPFGFQCSSPSDEITDITVIDNASLLTGVIGILLSLTSLNSTGKRPWMRMFLLS